MTKRWNKFGFHFCIADIALDQLDLICHLLVAIKNLSTLLMQSNTPVELHILTIHFAHKKHLLVCIAVGSNTLIG